MTNKELDILEEELLAEEDADAQGCGVVLSGGMPCGMGPWRCFKCNHGDGLDPRLPEHLRNAERR